MHNIIGMIGEMSTWLPAIWASDGRQLGATGLTAAVSLGYTVTRNMLPITCYTNTLGEKEERQRWADRSKIIEWPSRGTDWWKGWNSALSCIREDMGVTDE